MIMNRINKRMVYLTSAFLFNLSFINEINCKPTIEEDLSSNLVVVQLDFWGWKSNGDWSPYFLMREEHVDVKNTFIIRFVDMLS